MHKGEGEVLVEEVLQELAHAQVGPAAVHQQETLEVTELGEGVVAGENRLHALLAADTDTDVSSWGGGDERRRGHVMSHNSYRPGERPETNGLTLDHADVVGPVADGQSDGLLVFLDQLNHLGLLQRGDPAADHGPTHARRPQQLQVQTLLQRKGLRTEWENGIRGPQ